MPITNSWMAQRPHRSLYCDRCKDPFDDNGGARETEFQAKYEPTAYLCAPCVERFDEKWQARADGLRAHIESLSEDDFEAWFAEPTEEEM